MDFNFYPYASKRYVKYGLRGMCATSNHLAAQAGLDMLKKGGNAFDAVVAMATCLTVLEPQSNGIGGDAFAIFSVNGKMYGMNSSGKSPALISAQKVKDSGYTEMPRLGFTPVTVAGAPAAWAALNEKFGTLPLSDVMAPAIDYAKNGQPMSHMLHSSISGFAKTLAASKEDQALFEPWREEFLPDGKPVDIGERFVMSGRGETLELIANSGAKEFYQGVLADKIDAFSQKMGGYIRKSDLEAFTQRWDDPVSVNYRGYDVWELPPNGQGIIALMALNIFKNLEPSKRDDINSLHREIEALKLAFIDGKKYITDPDHMKVSVKDLLSPAYGLERSKLITDTAIEPTPGTLPSGGTVYLCASDNMGNMISYIQSNYAGFGSGVVVPGTGIQLQNRGNGFSLDEGDFNYLLPEKRTYHTIIPGFLSKDGVPVGPFGVMGGFMQPQGHYQVMLNYIDNGLNPQACLDAPRWQWHEGKKITLEPHYSEYLLNGLAARGHSVSYDHNRGSFGRGQMIFKYGAGLIGGTEPRTDGECATW